jgi:hypothetical protein
MKYEEITISSAALNKDIRLGYKLTLGNINGSFVIREKVDGVCKNEIYLSKDNIEKIFNSTK